MFWCSVSTPVTFVEGWRRCAHFVTLFWHAEVTACYCTPPMTVIVNLWVGRMLHLQNSFDHWRLQFLHTALSEEKSLKVKCVSTGRSNSCSATQGLPAAQLLIIRIHNLWLIASVCVSMPLSLLQREGWCFIPTVQLSCWSLTKLIIGFNKPPPDLPSIGTCLYFIVYCIYVASCVQLWGGSSGD